MATHQERSCSRLSSVLEGVRDKRNGRFVWCFPNKLYMLAKSCVLWVMASKKKRLRFRTRCMVCLLINLARLSPRELRVLHLASSFFVGWLKRVLGLQSNGLCHSSLVFNLALARGVEKKKNELRLIHFNDTHYCTNGLGWELPTAYRSCRSRAWARFSWPPPLPSWGEGGSHFAYRGSRTLLFKQNSDWAENPFREVRLPAKEIVTKRGPHWPSVATRPNWPLCWGSDGWNKLHLIVIKSSVWIWNGHLVGGRRRRRRQFPFWMESNLIKIFNCSAARAVQSVKKWPWSQGENAFLSPENGTADEEW